MAMDEIEQKAFNDLKVAKESSDAALKAKTDEHQKIVDEHKKLTDEIGGLRTKAQADQEAAKVKAEADKIAKDKVIVDRKAALVKAGLPQDKVNTLSEENITLMELAMTVKKPGADMGGGSGGSALTGSPYELAKLAYTK